MTRHSCPICGSQMYEMKPEKDSGRFQWWCVKCRKVITRAVFDLDSDEPTFLTAPKH